MLVSHFELIFKPQSPAAPGGTAAVDRVLQGYFLEITNLGDREYLYALEFVMAPPDPTLPQRSLAGNAVVFVDRPPGTDNQAGVLSGTLASSVFRPSTGFVRIPAGGTALVAVIPSVFTPSPDPSPLTVPNFEVRGHVVIKLPALFVPGTFFFRREPQSANPVRVMLTPQNRATFLKADGTISSQVQSSLPLASGTAENMIPPEPGGPLVLSEFNGAVFPDGLRERISELESSPTAVLASLLAGVEADDAGLAAFNKALAGAGVALAIAPAGRAVAS